MIAVTLTLFTVLAVGSTDPIEIKKDLTEVVSHIDHVDAIAKAASSYDLVTPAPIVMPEMKLAYTTLTEVPVSLLETEFDLLRDRSPPKIRLL